MLCWLVGVRGPVEEEEEGVFDMDAASFVGVDGADASSLRVEPGCNVIAGDSRLDNLHKW